MELGLSLGDSSKPFGFIEKTTNRKQRNLGFCMALSIGTSSQLDQENKINLIEDDDDEERDKTISPDRTSAVQLDLIPHGQIMPARGFDVNQLPEASDFNEEEGEGAAAMSSSPSRNSGTSSFQMDLCMFSGSGKKRGSDELLGEGENGDDDENGSTRKKLRLSKDQSIYLEESFKEHNTLNPKQKLALAKQLNLRPRQVEVWFQNRRARTKLKQTEVDCEYLKRCCETLTEENRRLHKELQELRVLKSSNSNPFYMQLPATTLTMCPSCERVATTSTAVPATKQTPFSLSRPKFQPFSQSQSKAS